MGEKMSRRQFLKLSATTGAILATGTTLLPLIPNAAFANEPKPIQLVRPTTGSSNPLIQLLKKRSSSREFSNEKLPLTIISAILWAAFGINRPDSGKRTAPSANNRQEIDIYLATGDGLYFFDANANKLNPVRGEDLRAKTGPQPFVKEAPVNLIYVADYAKIITESDEEKDFYSAANTGFISENVYLYCASEGLATVVRGWIDRPALAKAMGLGPNQKIILAQSVGYPKKA
jgi:nitroreductase